MVTCIADAPARTAEIFFAIAIPSSCLRALVSPPSTTQWCSLSSHSRARAPRMQQIETPPTAPVLRRTVAQALGPVARPPRRPHARGRQGPTYAVSCVDEASRHPGPVKESFASRVAPLARISETFGFVLVRNRKNRNRTFASPCSNRLFAILEDADPVTDRDCSRGARSKAGEKPPHFRHCSSRPALRWLRDRMGTRRCGQP